MVSPTYIFSRGSFSSRVIEFFSESSYEWFCSLIEGEILRNPPLIPEYCRAGALLETFSVAAAMSNDFPPKDIFHAGIVNSPSRSASIVKSSVTLDDARPFIKE